MTNSPPFVPTGSWGDQVFPLLADPAGYVACELDLATHQTMRAYWLGLFGDHFPTLIEDAVKEAGLRGLDALDTRCRLEQAGTLYKTYLDQLAVDPGCFGRFDIMTLCMERERLLRQAGIDDPYLLVKRRENEASLPLLPLLLKELDALSENERGRRLIEGVFAGNIFDLGATTTAKLFQDGPVDFRIVRLKLEPRPWLIDDLDAWLVRWVSPKRHREALLFVDNAGSDVVLGMIPLARELLRRGTGVLLAANSTPALNDVTYLELVELIGRVAVFEPVIAAALDQGHLELVASGNGQPLIDLKQVSPELVEATKRRQPDLVILEGMGRALESNLHAPLVCDTIKIAMVKDPGVADSLGGKIYDLVMRYEPAQNGGVV